MNIVLLKNNLKQGLDWVGRAVGSSLNLNSLADVLIKASENKISLSATNLEIAITAVVAGKIITDGEIAVPYSTISGIINNLPSERLALEVKEGILKIKSDNYDADLQGLSAEEFPIIPRLKESEEYLEINSTPFKENLERVIVAVEISEIKPEISGVFLVAEVNALRLVGTNNFRLAESIFSSASQFKNKFDKEIKIIIPLKTAEEIIRVIKNDSKISIFIEAGQVLIKSEEVEIISRLIEGQYPDYKSIIPKETKTEITVEKSELVNALRLSSIFAAKNSEIRLKTKDGKMIEIFSASSNLGKNNYIIPAKISGEETTIGFNWRYLLDGVKAVNTAQISLKLNGKDKPAVLSPKENQNYLYLLAPLKSSD